MKLARLFDLLVAEQLIERDEHATALGENLTALKREAAWVLPELLPHHLEEPVADRLAGLLHRTARHIRLARGRRGSGRPHPGVRREHGDALGTKLRPCDLGLDRDQALPHLGRGGMDPYERLAVLYLECHARGRVVVEALRVADVLEADRIPHPALYRLAVCRVGDAAGELAQVPTHRILLLRHGHVLDPLQDLGHRGGFGHLLPERELVPGLDGVLYAEL